MFAKNRYQKRKGLTGLETAIILIAFVITAAAFAFGVLNLGLTSTQKSTDVIRAGLGEASSALELDGGVVVKGTTSQPNNITFTIKLAAGREPIVIDSKAVISYIDPNKSFNNVYSSTVITKVIGDTDDILEAGEKWVFTVKLNDSGMYGATVSLSPLQKFRVEIKPVTGAVLTIERTIPAALEPVMYLG
ncbi:MAG: archaellin/type IV pilin N-terminal domain-containing protein [Nitrososphaerales archaeon]